MLIYRESWSEGTLDENPGFSLSDLRALRFRESDHGMDSSRKPSRFPGAMIPLQKAARSEVRPTKLLFKSVVIFALNDPTKTPPDTSSPWFLQIKDLDYVFSGRSSRVIQSEECHFDWIPAHQDHSKQICRAWYFVGDNVLKERLEMLSMIVGSS
nr:hypothetical protein CFP56_31726 [Quercus suber]